MSNFHYFPPYPPFRICTRNGKRSSSWRDTVSLTTPASLERPASSHLPPSLRWAAVATQFRRVQAAAIELRTLLAFAPQPTPAVLAPPPTPPPRLPSTDPGSSSSTGTAVATSRARAMLHELQFPELTEQPALPEVAQLAHDE